MRDQEHHPSDCEPIPSFAIVGCSDCDNVHVVYYQKAVSPDSRTVCPRCETEHRGKQRVIETAETQAAAKQIRSKVVADRMGQSQAFQEFMSNGGADQVEIQEPKTSLDYPTHVVDDERQAKEELAEQFVEEKDQTPQPFEDEVDASDISGKDRFEDLAEESLGKVGKYSRSPLGESPENRLPDIQKGMKWPDESPIDAPDLRDIIELPATEGVGLTTTQQTTVPDTVTLDAQQPISDIWQAFIVDEEVQCYLLHAVRNATAGRDSDELKQIMDAAGIVDEPTTTVPSLRGLLLRIGSVVDPNALWDLIDDVELETLGHGASSTQNIFAVTKLFGLATPAEADGVEVPTVEIHIDHAGFSDRPRQQRTKVCKFISLLSSAFDTRLVCTGVTTAYLRQHHRSDLPPVHDWAPTRHIDSRVVEAIDDLDADGGEFKILDVLSDAPDNTLSYDQLESMVERQRETIRGYISELDGYGLIEKFGPGNEKKLQLLDSGKEVHETIIADQGRQAKLDGVLATPKTHPQRRVTRDRDERRGSLRGISKEGLGVEGDAQETAFIGEGGAKNYVTYMRRTRHDAIGACGVDSGSIAVTDAEIGDIDSKEHTVSFDAERNEAVVSTSATSPRDYVVGSARAFSSPLFIQQALDLTTLERVLDETHPKVLRDERHIGWLTDEVLDDAEMLQETFIEWGEDIQKMTHRLEEKRYGGDEYENRSELLSDIFQECHGLTASIVHFLDEAGIDVNRELRITGNLSIDQLEKLATTIAKSVQLQSVYDQFNAHRQLYEMDDSYRDRSRTPEVDAKDPTASLIGSIVLRGTGAGRVVDPIVSKLKTAPTHEDAPEISLPVTVRDPTRENVAVAATRVLSRKNLRPTREAVSVLDAICDSPYAVTKALEQLQGDETRREVDASEIRFALTHLCSEEILSEQPRSVGEIVMTLLEASKPLTQAELVDRAGISNQTIRNHRESLIASGLVRHDADGCYRIALSFRSERGEEIFPRSCTQSLDSLESTLEEADIEDVALTQARDICVALTGSPTDGIRREVEIGIPPEQTAILDGDAQTGSEQHKPTERDASTSSENNIANEPTGFSGGNERDGSVEGDKNVADRDAQSSSDRESDDGLDFSGVEIPGMKENI